MASFNREALWDKGHDSAVQVNQRALIDKVLARYSGEFTVFRELLQNSDDAGSKNVEIHFRTADFADEQLREGDGVEMKGKIFDRWIFKNDGMDFREEDWDRLKKIAEGNPDEDKIGAFGVGFYSLFSITEEPFVTSGDQWMGFYWRVDQLIARKGTVPASTNITGKKWTSFALPLRTPSPLPAAPLALVQFLASSLPFSISLESISVIINDTCIARIKKRGGMDLEKKLITGLKTNSKVGRGRGIGETGIMDVREIGSGKVEIGAEVRRAVYTFDADSRKKPMVSNLAANSTTATTATFFSFFSQLKAATPAPSTPAPETSESTPPTPDPNEMLSSSISLTVFSAHASVSLTDGLAKELVRSTKKKAPKKITYQLVYTNKEAYDASLKEDEEHMLGSSNGNESVFKGLRADINGSGTAKIFIGHATGQTTGVGGHMAARFIPTVERESIDFVDKNVAVWNKELLYVGGYLARTVYEYEMAEIRSLWLGALPSPSSKVSPEIAEWLYAKALHIMSFFAINTSTPSNMVSRLLQNAFYSCSGLGSGNGSGGDNFPIMSSHGVLPVSRVRFSEETYAEFVKGLPVIPPSIQHPSPSKQRPKMLTDLSSLGLLLPIILTDVVAELRARPLVENEMVACLRWYFALDKSTFTVQLRTQFLDAAVVVVGERVIPLNSIKTFVSAESAGSVIPVSPEETKMFPLPAHTFPYTLSRQLPASDGGSASSSPLQVHLLWKPLDLTSWLSHALSTPSLILDEKHSTKLITIISRSWASSLTGPATKAEVLSLLAHKPCVPTRNGMMIPRDAYFPSVDIFPDLPVVQIAGVGGKAGGGSGKQMEALLEALGVRRHVDLQLIFTRVFKTGDWSTVDLIKYLSSMRKDLTDEEMRRLAQTKAFLPEYADGGNRNSTEKSIDRDEKVDPNKSSTSKQNTSMPATKGPRCTADTLYEPTDAHRQAGLPVLEWASAQRWRSSSKEAEFLFEIGLLKHPTLKTILTLASSQNKDIDQRPKALQYFVDNFENLYKKEYESSKFPDLAYIPAIEAGGTVFLARPSEVFADPEAALFGFSVVHPHFRSNAVDLFKVRKEPPADFIVNLLKSSPPQYPVQANRWFEALSGKLQDFSTEQQAKLSTISFIPKEVQSPKGPRVAMYKPSECYLNNDNAAKFHSELFVFVDYSDKASHFLRVCGLRDAPSTQEVAQILVKDPRRFLEQSGHRENFLAELRNLAVNEYRISSSVKSKMSRTTCLLGLRRQMSESRGKLKTDLDELDDEYDADWQYEHDLALPKNIAIVDDTSTYTLFAELIFSAPQEDLLETFYAKLGSPRLSSLIKEEYNPTGLAADQSNAAELRSLILSRLSLFLHQHSHSRTAVEHSWLAESDHFVVNYARRIQLTKHLRFNGINASRSVDASASAIRSSKNGSIILWVAGEVDMYEVANSLLSIVLKEHKVNDSLLFSTILSTDLRALRRRGYNVDRILKQQRADRAAQEKAELDAMREIDDKKPGSVPPSFTEDDGHHPTFPGPVVAPPPLYTEHEEKQSGFLSGFKRMMKKQSHAKLPKDTLSSPITPLSSASQLTPPAAAVMPPVEEIVPDNSVSAAARSTTDTIEEAVNHASQYEASPPEIIRATAKGPGSETSPQNIYNNVQQAIMACRPTNASLLQNRTTMTTVKEAMEEGYCDVSGHAKDVVKIGILNNMLVYATKDVPHMSHFIAQYLSQLDRFTLILKSLANLYNIPTHSLHVFYDLSGGLIAFNRGGSIFLNFRYYLAWHDHEVLAGDQSNAYISWFFSLAHEIAHNLVGPHNAEHEFYFSSICEAHMGKLCHVLGPMVSRSSVSTNDNDEKANLFDRTSALFK